MSWKSSETILNTEYPTRITNTEYKTEASVRFSVAGYDFTTTDKILLKNEFSCYIGNILFSSKFYENLAVKFLSLFWLILFILCFFFVLFVFPGDFFYSVSFCKYVR